MLCPFVVLAQTAVTDPISGGAGWAGAGLLGLVLAWLLFMHLPSKDKQLKELIEHMSTQLTAKDSHMERVTGEFQEALEKLQAFFREESRVNREFWREQLEAIHRIHGGGE